MHLPSIILLYLSPIVALAARSRDGTCGGSKGNTCLGSTFGNCCSTYGWCGSTSAYCSTGCQPRFGDCKKVAPASPTGASTRSSSTGFRTVPIASRISSSRPAATQSVSTNARCGPAFGGKTCLGSRWGNCCSQYSYCGSTIDYCAAESCQQGFGLCNSVSSSSLVSTTRSSVPSSASSSASHISSSSPPSIETLTSSSSSSTPEVASTTSAESSVSSTDSASSAQEASSSTIPTTSSLVVISSTTAISPTTPTACAVVLPTCEQFTGPLTGTCGTSNGKCQSGYQKLCTQAPAGSSTLGRQLRAPKVVGGDACAAACDLDPTCMGFVFTATGPVGQICDLYTKIDGTSTNWVTTYLKVCDQGNSVSQASALSSSLSPTSSSSEIPTSSSMVESSSTPAPTPSTTSTSASSSTVTSSTPAAPIAQPTCGVLGNGKNGILYRSLALVRDQASCKRECEEEINRGTTCRVYALSKITNQCLLSLGSPGPDFGQAFVPTDQGFFAWFDVGCEINS